MRFETTRRSPDPRRARILDGVLQVEEHAWPVTPIALVDQHRAPLQEITLSFQCQVNHRIEQWVPGTDERRQGLALRCNQRLLEGDALVARQYRLADADQSVSIPDRRRNVGDLVAPRLALLRGTAEALERFAEERLDVVRLEAARFRSHHVLSYSLHAACVHCVVCKGTLFQQVLEPAAVEGVIDRSLKAGANLGLLPVAYGLNHEFAQRPPFEVELAEHVKHLTAERFPRLLQLLQELAVDVAFARLVRHQVPEVTHLGLTDAVYPPKALFQTVRVPGQVVVHHQVRALQVDAFARGVGGEQHLDLRVVAERFLGLEPILATHAAVNCHDGALASQQ